MYSLGYMLKIQEKVKKTAKTDDKTREGLHNPRRSES